MKIDISICFVHKSRNLAIFGLTCIDKRSRDFVTEGPIFEIFVLKRAQDPKEKSHQAAARHLAAFWSNKKNSGGGGHYGPPRP